ncbi:MAG: HAD hydrolase family protein [Oscillospiraceae bacterium]|nr:HAD hydrolase family protein [Oscillospiraceae bacterium]
MHTIKSHFPRIGMRIVKSAAAVGLSMAVYLLLGVEGLPFFIIIAALQGMQQYQRNVREITVRNVFGTLVGAACALPVVLLQYFVLAPHNCPYVWYCALVTFGIAVALYSSVVLGHGDAAYFTAVVYLCIVMVHLDNQNPLSYVLQRLTETLLGIGIGMGVNAMRIPIRRVRDTLFVAALDDVLHSESSILPEYSKVEINRILDDGVRLSIISQHSSASFWEAAGSIRFKMPVILLDGAVLYDPAEKRYLAKVQLEYEQAREITELLEDEELSIFQSAVIDDSVMIFNRHIAESTREIHENMRRSNYRNYIYRQLPEGLPVIYVLCMGTEEKLDEAYEKLKAAGFDKKYKVMRYGHEQKGMGYMRIFSMDADRHAMLEKLREVCGIEKLRTFGNDPELYDVCVRTSEGESILKALKKEAEPFFWKKAK